jgi:hypothetical protein
MVLYLLDVAPTIISGEVSARLNVDAHPSPAQDGITHLLLDGVLSANKQVFNAVRTARRIAIYLVPRR